MARCAEGHVISGSVIASAPDVKIVEQIKVDCDTTGLCMAYQVTALRKNGKAFDIDVTEICTEDGLDTELDRLLVEQAAAETTETEVEGTTP